jgi:hypothetical protein
VLTRELRVRVVNISNSGCLIESNRRMAVGTVGTLRLRWGSQEYADGISVVRCVAIEGAGAVYRVGVRFLWTTLPHDQSIRHAVSKYVALPSAGLAGRVM